MAAKFPGVGTVDDYTIAAAGLPASNVLSMTFWLYLSVDRNAFSTIIQMMSSGGQNVVFLTTLADGTTLAALDQGGNLTSISTVALTVGTWYRVGLVVNGNTTTLYSGGDTGSLTSSSGSVTVATTPNLTTIGDGLNGRVAAFKLWDTTLTADEIEAELAQYEPTRFANLLHWHPFVTAELADYSGSGNTLGTSGSGSGITTEEGPPLPWGHPRASAVTLTPIPPFVDAGKDVFGTAGFEFSIQAVESGSSITSRSWTVVNGPAEVATVIGTTSLLSWFPATPGVYELEYRIINSAGEAYDTVYATVNDTGTIVNSASVSGTTTTLTCNKPTSTAADDVMLAVQSGDFNDLDLMTSPNDWQPLFEYDVGLDNLHTKGWTLTAGASEPASYNFTQGTGSAGTVTIVAMRGVVEAGVRREIVPDTGTTATRTCPTVEGAVPGSILLCGAMTDPGAARTWTPPSGMTEQADLQSGTAITHSVASLLNPADPTGTKDFTLSGTTVAPGGIQWSAVFPMPADPQRRGANKSMFTVVKTR